MDPLMNHFPLKKISISSTFTCLQLPYDVLLMCPLWLMFTDAAIEPNKEEVPPVCKTFRGVPGCSWAEFNHKSQLFLSQKMRQYLYLVVILLTDQIRVQF